METNPKLICVDEDFMEVVEKKFSYVKDFFSTKETVDTVFAIGVESIYQAVELPDRLDSLTFAVKFILRYMDILEHNTLDKTHKLMSKELFNGSSIFF